MYWFKNAMIYQLTSPLYLRSDELENKLQSNKFYSCTQSDMSRFGWDMPLITSEALHHSYKQQYLIVAHREEKILPNFVIQEEANKRIKL